MPTVLLFPYLKSRLPQTAPVGERTAEKGRLAAGCAAFAGVPVRCHRQVRGGDVLTDGRTRQLLFWRRDRYNRWTGPRAYGPQALTRPSPCPNDAQARPLCGASVKERPHLVSGAPSGRSRCCNAFQKCFHQEDQDAQVLTCRRTSVEPQENVQYVRGVVSRGDTPDTAEVQPSSPPAGVLLTRGLRTKREKAAGRAATLLAAWGFDGHGSRSSPSA